MCLQELVLRQRTQILDALCSSGSTQHLEQVLDILLAQGLIIWEEYQNTYVQCRSLYTNARQLLDLVYTKGVQTCGSFLAALKQVLPELQIECPSFLLGSLNNDEKEACSVPTQTLLAQRPHLIKKLQDSIDEVLEVLVISGHFTSADCDEVRLPIHTPSKQARSLLDHARSKGESAAEVVLQYIQQQEESGSPPNQEKLNPSKEFLKYRKKLSSSVSAQSCLLSTYGWNSNMSLEDMYTDVQLDLPHGCANVHEPMRPGDILDMTGTLNEEADMVLLSGEAGSGKSTLLQRLHFLWARGLGLQEFVLLFPFSCRRLNAEHRELSVQELLFQHCCWPDKEQEEIFQFILDHSHLILFTFDGLDELKQSFSDEHRLCCPTQRVPVHILLFNLIQGSLMKGVRKVVTSRPEAVGPLLKKYIRKEVLVKGFSKSAISCFVRKHHSDPTVAATVWETIQKNTALLGLCHSPVLCWIVSECHKELLGCGEGSPQTITDVYLMILQHFIQHHNSTKGTVGSGWLKEHLKTVLKLGKLAFEGIENTCYIFTDDALETCGVNEQDFSIGFLVQCKDLSSIHGKVYEFLHLTMQCFFAALYIILSSNFEHSTITKLFEHNGPRVAGPSVGCILTCVVSNNEPMLSSEGEASADENLQITATFVSGLLSQRHQCLWVLCCPRAMIKKKVRQVLRHLTSGMQRHFKSIPKPVAGEKKSMHAMPSFVWLIKCIYEMQDSRIAKDSLRKLEVEHIKLTYCNIGPTECTALAFVLKHLKNPVGLQLDNNSIGDVGLEQLLPCLHRCKGLYLNNDNISDEGIRKLVAKGIDCESFQKISLFNNKLTDACTQYLSHLLKNKQDFLAMRLGNNNITAEGAKQLAEGLKVNRSLQYLGLWGNKVGDTGAEALARAFESTKSLVWLSLVGNGVGSAGAIALANVVKTSASLQDLWLMENHITRTGVECLIQALEYNTHMKSIWLRKNDLSLEEEEELKQRESRLIF